MTDAQTEHDEGVVLDVVDDAVVADVDSGAASRTVVHPEGPVVELLAETSTSVASEAVYYW